ncbi:hypothetical protein pb186bvf_013496 [Paramecium bursaria]
MRQALSPIQQTDRTISLPRLKLPLSDSEKNNKKKFYNKWYIPYERRFLAKKAEQNLHDEITKSLKLLNSNPHVIYNQLSKPQVDRSDPFAQPVTARSQETSTIEQINDNGGQMMKKYKDYLIKSKQRVPYFLQLL